MKLRKVLFILIVVILVFDIVLIVRHKRLHEKSPLAAKQPEYKSDPLFLDPGMTVSGDAVLGPSTTYLQFNLPTGFLRCPVDSQVTLPLHCEMADGKKMKLVLVPDDPNFKPKPAPKIEHWERLPPAPKPAGERKLL